MLVDSESAVILRHKAPHQQRQLEHVVEWYPVSAAGKRLINRHIELLSTLQLRCCCSRCVQQLRSRDCCVLLFLCDPKGLQ
jgi:hypothetical protein